MEELKWVTLGSVLGSMMFIRTIRDYIPPHLWSCVEKYIQKLVRYVYPYTDIIFDEYSDDRFSRSEVFASIQTYLSAKASVQTKARRFKADLVRDSKSLLLSMDDSQEVPDEFKEVKVWWALVKHHPRREYNPYFSFDQPPDEKRQYKLTFHKRHLELIKTSYISHVLAEGKATTVKNRQRMLYSNSGNKNGYWRARRWSHIYFEHPANFDTLAMESKKKEEIKKDLLKFSRGKEYYQKIGKAWKRGYLLYGPPGTGKSTMVAAMANFLDYDVYDLELTTVSNNTDLRSLLVDVPGKSILVIEDIDCSLDLTGQRQKKKENDAEEETDPVKKKAKQESENKQSQVTLSGLLNAIDGIWSASGGERIVVFTTNYKEKLDPALIRRGRMDKHIEMSYCCFESFKVLAKNYLDIDAHKLYAEIGRLLAETNMTPADVAENLMPKSDEEEDPETCLKNLIEALKVAKEDQAKKKAEEEARLKAEKEQKENKNDVVENGKHEDASANNSGKENGFIDKEINKGGES